MSSTARFRLMGALVAVLLLHGAAVGGAGQTEENPYTGRVDVRMGQRQFEARCSTCHGQQAKGSPEGGGPDLTTGRFRHATSDAGLFRVIREGVEGTAMVGVRPQTSDQAVWQMIAYVRSLGPAGDPADLPGSAAAGAALFEGKGDCRRCHMVDGEGGRLGPDLSRIGERRDAATLEIDLRDPNAEVDPRWWTVRLTRDDGSIVEGLRMHEDSFSFRLMDQEANLRSFSKRAVRSFERITESTMASYSESLTDEEIDDLVAYLASLRKES